MSLAFEVSSCVRATSKLSECTKCVDICPVNTIEIVDNIPSFIPSACVDCGGCSGVCPTESFSLTNFSTVDFFFELLEDKDKLISCKKNVPCLASLSVEHLISLALASEDSISLDMGHCTQCEIREPLQAQIEANIEEANFILSSFSDKKLLPLDIAYGVEPIEIPDEVSSRRDFFSLKGAVKQKDSFDKAIIEDELKLFNIDNNIINKIKDKNIPNKRKIFLTTLKQVTKPDKYEVLPEEDVSFVSQKFVDESCTNCQICYRICPTGALSSDGKFSVINFNSMLCVKCHLCHDVCEPDSIKLQSGFEIKEFFEPTQRTLASFNIKRCNECGGHFTYQGGEQMCLRCKVEEDEALTLHQNEKEMEF